MMYIEDHVIYKGSLINNGLKINKKYIVTDIYDLSGNFKYIRLSGNIWIIFNGIFLYIKRN